MFCNADEDGEVVGTADNPHVPMAVMGVMDRDGLGCTSWWEGDGGA